MTLARTALRLAAAQTLKGVTGSRPTIAEGRVYDSRIADIEPETFSDDAKPIIIVLTDGEEGEALSKQNGGPPFRRMVDLVLEIAMVQRLPDEDQEGSFVVGYPDTDARHEASLDFLEYQIMRALNESAVPMAIVFRKIARIIKEDSHRQVMDDSGVKVACRIVTLVCDTVDDAVPVFQIGSAPTGVAILPLSLQWVAEAMPAGTAGADVIAGLIADMTPIEFAPLTGISFKVDANPASGGTPNAEGIVQIDVDLPSNTPTQP